jgi:adenylate cyclase
MATEIERKFLVAGDGWKDAVVTETRLTQGYLASSPRVTVRVRVKGDQGVVTIKGATQGISRAEFEYPIPVEDARAMLDTLVENGIVDKVRYRVPCGRHTWEVDVFAGDNAGLVLAEIELDSEDEPFVRPDWLGEEVSDDSRYYNANLARHPYRSW